MYFVGNSLTERTIYSNKGPYHLVAARARFEERVECFLLP